MPMPPASSNAGSVDAWSTDLPTQNGHVLEHHNSRGNIQDVASTLVTTANGAGMSATGAQPPSRGASPALASGATTPSGGMGPGVYLVVDPTTGRVVGTAQATNPSTPVLSLTGASTPVTGSGTPIGIGSARSSLDIQGCGIHGGISGFHAATAAMGTSATASCARTPPAPTTYPGTTRSPGPDLADATLSLLGASGGANSAAAAAAASSLQALLVEQLGGMASAAGGGAAGLPSLSSMLQGGLGGTGGGGASSAVSDAAMAVVVEHLKGLDPLVAAQLLQEGLANNELSDDAIMALAQAAGILDPITGQLLPEAATAAVANAAAATSPFSAQPHPVAVAGATPSATSGLFTGLQAAGISATPLRVPALATPTGRSSLGVRGSGGPAAGGGGGGLLSPRGPMTSAAAAATAAAAGMGGLLAGLASPGGLGAGHGQGGLMGTGPKHNSLYKTELCRSWTESGSCRYGSKCQFAHGQEELRPVMRHPKYKTEICRTFATNGTCHYGPRCRFIHVAPGSPAALAALAGTSQSPGPAGFSAPQQQAANAAAAFGMLASPRGIALGARPNLGALAAGIGGQPANADAAGGLWNQPNNALPAAAAALLSPTGRGPLRHSLQLSSPPHKMVRREAGTSSPDVLLATDTAGSSGSDGGTPTGLAAARSVDASLQLLSPTAAAGHGQATNLHGGPVGRSSLELLSHFGGSLGALGAFGSGSSGMMSGHPSHEGSHATNHSGFISGPAAVGSGWIRSALPAFGSGSAGPPRSGSPGDDGMGLMGEDGSGSFVLPPRPSAFSWRRAVGAAAAAAGPAGSSGSGAPAGAMELEQQGGSSGAATGRSSMGEDAAAQPASL